MRRFFTAFLFAFLLVPDARAAGRELAPRPPIPAQGETLEVAAAGGRFLTVWTVNSGAIYGAISDAQGHRLSASAFLIAQRRVQLRPSLSVVGTGDSFAVFWNDHASVLDPLEVHLTDVALDGRILGTKKLDLPSAESIRAAWDGQRFLVAIQRENRYTNRSLAAFVTRDGTTLRADMPLDPSATPIHVAVIYDGFLVFSRGRDFLGHRVHEDGGVEQFIAGDPGTNVVSAPIGEGRLLVAYILDDGQLRTMLWKDGVKLNEQTLTVDRDAVPAGILPGQGEHLLVYGREEPQKILLHDRGEPVSQPEDLGTVLHGAQSAFTNGQLFIAHRTDDSIQSLTLPANTADTVSMRPAPQSHVLVGAGGGSMIAIWNEARGDGGMRIRAARIDRDFHPEEAHEIVAEGALVTRSLAWNGTEYLVVYETFGAQIHALRVAYDGTPIGEPRLLAEPGDPVHAAAVWAGDRWAVAWVSTYGSLVVYYQTVSHGGAPSPVQELDVTDARAFDVALAFDGNRVHLAWIQTAYEYYPEPPPQGHAVFLTRLRRNGRLIDETPLPIPSTGPRELAMAGNGEYVVLLVDEEQRTALHRIVTRTRQITASRLLYDRFGKDGDVTWTGYTFVAAVQHRVNDRTLLEIYDLGAAATSTERPRVTETLASRDLHVSVASSPAYDAVAGVQESDAAAGDRAVIYAEREMYRFP